VNKISAEAFRALSNSARTTPICPNICRLIWNPQAIHCGEQNLYFPYLRLFLGPDTKLFEMDVCNLDIAGLSGLQALPHHYPHLIDIILYCENTFRASDKVVDIVSASLGEYRLLESFTCWTSPTLSHRGILGLASIPTLKTLNTEIPDLMDYHEGFQSALKGPGFPSLQHLNFGTKNLSTCTFLISIMPFGCQLGVIEVDSDADRSPALGQFFQTVNMRCSHLTLTSLSIRYRGTTAHLDGVVHEDIFRPLLVFTNMAEVQISTCHAFSLGNEIIRDISVSWPQLRSLRIGTSQGWARHSRITLAGLIPLLSLPQLNNLGIVIDASIVDHTLDMPLAGVCNTKICHLDLGDSVIQSAPLVAAFMSDVLPNLRLIDSWKDVMTEE